MGKLGDKLEVGARCLTLALLLFWFDFVAAGCLFPTCHSSKQRDDWRAPRVRIRLALRQRLFVLPFSEDLILGVPLLPPNALFNPARLDLELGMFGNVVEAGWASVHVSASIRVEPFGFLGVLGQVLLGGMQRVALEFQAQSYRVSPLLIIADAVGAQGSRRGAGRLGSVGRRRLTESLSIALKALGVVEQRVQARCALRTPSPRMESAIVLGGERRQAGRS